MALMRGKFYVYRSFSPQIEEEIVVIHHAADTDDEKLNKIAEETGIDTSGFRVDPEELLTGVKENEQIWLPAEVFNALAVRMVDRMSPAEREAARQPTRWEAFDKLS